MESSTKNDEEDEYEDGFDAGVSQAMSEIDNVPDRVSMLLIHGILHLLGYVLQCYCADMFLF